MLKVYKVGAAVKIDDNDWKALDVWPSYQILDEEIANNPKFESYDSSSWIERIKTISDKVHYDAVYWNETFFKKRPYLAIRYRKDNDKPVRYFEGDFQRIQFCPIYVEIKPSIEFIMKRFDANKAISYLKECGMTMCPIIND